MIDSFDWAYLYDTLPGLLRGLQLTLSDEDELSHQIRSLQRDFLGDHAADGKAQYVDELEIQRADEGDGVRSHLLECRRHGASRTGNPGIVE